MELEDKRKIVSLARETIKTKLLELKSLGENLKRSLAEETKSSAGDKHETGRAMVHLEQENLSKQSEAFQRMLIQLEALKLNAKHQKIQTGSLFLDSGIWYFVSVALGKIELASENVYCISEFSPLAKAVMNLQANDQFTFQGKSRQVEVLI